MKVLIAETIDWDASVRIGSHHYANQFLEKGHEVLFISQYLHPLSLITGDSQRTYHAFKHCRGMKVKNTGLSLYTPISLLPCRSRKPLDCDWVGRRSLKFTFPPLQTVLKKLGFEKVDILWISNPLFAGLADLVAHDVLAFRVNDLYTGFKGMPKCVKNFEEKLVERADLVFATSNPLMKRIENIGGKAIYLPNGAEFEHFHSTAPPPDEYASIPAPRIIFCGAIEKWFDTALVIETARRLPEISFVLIGKCDQKNAEMMAGIPNIYILGPRSYAELPGYYQNADAGMVPFKINDLTNAVSPIKLYEYFAAGLPVVATNLNEVQQFKTFVKFADDADEFSAAILEILRNGKDDGLRNQRIQCAKSNSWKARFDVALHHIQKVLDAGKSS